MGFQDRDKALQQQIISSLIERQTINMNKEVGVAYLQPEFEDKVNPSVTITRKEIKEITKRDKIRNVVVDDFEKALRRPGIEVERLDIDTLKVSLVPMRKSSNEFKSFTDLTKKNAVELAESPELGEPLY